MVDEGNTGMKHTYKHFMVISLDTQMDNKYV